MAYGLEQLRMPLLHGCHCLAQMTGIEGRALKNNGIQNQEDFNLRAKHNALDFIAVLRKVDKCLSRIVAT